MLLSAFENAIYVWVAGQAAEGVTVIWDEPSHPRPESPSIRLSWLAPPSGIGQDELRGSAAHEDAFNIVGPRPATLSIIAYGEESYQIMLDLQSSISDPDVMDTLGDAYSVLDTSPVRDVTFQLETEYEKRAQMDITMLATEDKEIRPGLIKSVEIEGELAVSDPDADPYEITITADNGD